MLSLPELERVAGALTEELAGGRVERWVEPEPGRICVSIYRRDEGEGRKLVIDIDARPELAHVARLDRMPKAPASMPAFCAYLRAHLSRARLVEASLRGGDRQLALHFEAERGVFVLLLSIFGRRSNLYLLDSSDRLVLALRPLGETRPELSLGSAYLDPGSPAPRAGTDRFASIPAADLLHEIAVHYAGANDDRVEDADRRRLLGALKKERKSAARRLERIEAELAESDEASTLQRHGELLKSNLARIEPGAASIEVRDFEDDRPVVIPLDPRLSGKANLEAIFKRYQKLIRRLTKAGGQVGAARENLRRVEALESEVADAEDLGEILSRDFVRKLLGRHESGRGSPASENVPARPLLPSAYRALPRKLHPRRYRSVDGCEIWVGRSDEGNDVLTTRLARSKDLFFHLDGAPGSHVILRTEGRDDPPPESILDACELAVHYSKQKNATRADVHVVPIKNVKKPKGAKRGLVYVSGGKSVHLRRQAERLERLLASRIDD
jgi:predicted ribosome quality control (RQC) complex YloA/Tae2 family protein